MTLQDFFSFLSFKREGLNLNYSVKNADSISDLLELERQLLIGILRTIIFSLIVIVAFARKSNVQQVVSVEDFWGGIFTE
ncbi:MAG: hypothetical protein F6K48_34365 [Okeania sp. SIO3H1]|uniref:hypothetical protein n=1 Tax=Okeania sp. SIO1I7 TaxID=2607772 RepID=UPI0013C8AF82|nr:hypothetical protein [Okeania sp. SIO1I7]NEN93685.1 hypothetical protein [Okeania sp. SIO3H1]NET24556.1 hypothetical protein [Okeania sp. SIO1I7]